MGRNRVCFDFCSGIPGHLCGDRGGMDLFRDAGENVGVTVR